MESLARPSVSFMKDAWNRIRKSRVAVICMIILGLIILGAIFCPMLTPFSYSEQNVAFQNKPIMSPDSVTGQMHILVPTPWDATYSPESGTEQEFLLP